MTLPPLPYCGAPPVPADLPGRFNLDPVLIAALVLLATLHISRARETRGLALAGWLVTGAALVSPLCALSVSLFAARVAQHMVLVLVAAPMLALSLPAPRWVLAPAAVWASGAAFLAALWFWHMPVPYAATFQSTLVYWTMHLTLFGSALMLWAVLLRQTGPAALIGGMAASVQMGLLGAVICFARAPMYSPHWLTTEAWGLTPLADQQLGGALMWVPGCLLFVWVAVRAMALAWQRLEGRAA